ncbi:MAG: UDP-2,4-diacetamido-2,4,6-trideoxy-beta-L-altropyranose hydrolase [Deltaproteobacteria bacterium]|nr:UDP-2,4-diacetamido-2,4,6-trideoxy-beta-L-altropyranose hydrolase [Deltaproteobacteria bacterium]
MTVIDDLADRPHDCDLLLDQNFYENLESRYDGLAPSGCKKLLGPKYALLRPEFREERKNLRKRDGYVKRIMIFFGGSDPTNETTKALEAVRMLNRPDIAVDVVVGSANPNKDKINKLCASMANVAYHCQVENMAQLMTAADLFIGGGGSTTWERCCLELPGLIMATAMNQEAITVGCDQAGIGIHINKSKNISPNQIQIEIEKMFLNQTALLTMGKKSANMVDGKGANHVASFLTGCEKQGATL